MEYVRKSTDKRELHKREYDITVNERQMQTTKEKDDVSKALVEISRSIYDKEPTAEERESASAKPHHVIASSNSRNSSKKMPRFSLNNMVHHNYLEEAKNKTHDIGTSINVQEEQNLALIAGTPSNLRKERIKAIIKENVISRRP
nr:hypothetical protein [Tanacetum cinerariifolium]